MSKQRKKHNNTNANNGFDFKNFDINNMGNLLNNMNPNQLAGILNGIDINQLKNMFQNFNANQEQGQDGPRIANNNTKSVELLNAIKPMVNAERSQLIDSIIQLYTISRIIKK
jgi:hypothetical protein